MIIKRLFIFGIFFIIPFIQLIIVANNYKKYKRINKLGKRILPYKSLCKPYHLKFTICWFFVIISISLFLVFFSKNFYYIVIIFICLPFFLMSLLINKTSQKNGIYENGVICGLIIPWGKICSWKVENESTIYLYKKSGVCITLKEVENIDVFVNVIKTKVIMENE